MLTLQEKYEAKMRQKERFWLQDASEYFHYAYDLSVKTDKKLIFCLFKNEDIWTGFYEDKVRYCFNGQQHSVTYKYLEELFETHMRAIGKDGLDDTVSGDGHEIWVANKWTYSNSFNFAMFMAHALEVKGKRKIEFH